MALRRRQLLPKRCQLVRHAHGSAGALCQLALARASGPAARTAHCRVDRAAGAPDLWLHLGQAAWPTLVCKGLRAATKHGLCTRLPALKAAGGRRARPASLCLCRLQLRLPALLILQQLPLQITGILLDLQEGGGQRKAVAARDLAFSQTPASGEGDSWLTGAGSPRQGGATTSATAGCCITAVVSLST